MTFKSVSHGLVRRQVAGSAVAVVLLVLAADRSRGTRCSRSRQAGRPTLGQGDVRRLRGTPHDPLPRADDQTFLRRATLDLVGHSPSPKDHDLCFRFGANKRGQAVERLLANPQFGENWARYWRDVIFYRRTEDRALLAAPAPSRCCQTPSTRIRIGTRSRGNSSPLRETSARRRHGPDHGSDANAEDTTAEISRISWHPDSMRAMPQPSDRPLEARAVSRVGRVLPARCRAPAQEGRGALVRVVSMDRPKGKKDDKKPKRGNLEHHMPDLKHPEQEVR